MKNNIISFPSEAVRNWNTTSLMLKDILVEKGMPESTAAKFIEDFKPIYDSFQFEYPFSFAVSDQKEGEVIKEEFIRFQSALQKHSSKLMLNRFAREVEIFCNNLPERLKFSVTI